MPPKLWERWRLVRQDEQHQVGQGHCNVRQQLVHESKGPFRLERRVVQRYGLVPAVKNATVDSTSVRLMVVLGAFGRSFNMNS